MYSDKLNEALHYVELGRHEQALSIINSMLADEPNNGFLLYIAAECYYNLDKYLEAEQYTKESLNNGYSMEEGNYLLGCIYMDLERFFESERCFLEVLRLESNHASAFSAYGMLMLRTGHEKKAVQLMNEAMRIEPENPVVLHYRLMYFMYKDNRTEQLKVMERYLNNSSNEVTKLLHLGTYNLHNKNFKQARENFRQAFLLDPTNENVLEMLVELDKHCNIIFLPNRIVDKIGAPVLWLSFMVLFLILYYFKQDKILIAILILYILFALSTYISPLLYRVFRLFMHK